MLQEVLHTTFFRKYFVRSQSDLSHSLHRFPDFALGKTPGEELRPGLDVDLWHGWLQQKSTNPKCHVWADPLC